MQEKLKRIIELAEDNELGDLLADFAAGRSTEEAVTSAYHQGRSNAYAEIVALLEGRVKFENGVD